MNVTTMGLLRQVAPLVLACGVIGCGSVDAPPFDGDDPVGAAMYALGTPVDGCASGFANGTLALTVGSAPLVLTAQGGQFRANGYVCRGTINNVSQALTTMNVAKIQITGDAQANKVVLDFLPGTFGTKVLSRTGGVVVDFATTSGGNDSVVVRGSTGPDAFKFGKVGSSPDYLVEVSRDRYADVRIAPGSSLSLTAALSGGNDLISARPTSADIGYWRDTTVTIEPLPIGITAYGGAGDDLFTSGTGDDAFFGGAGNDTFKATAHPDGQDVFSGDDGVDTADYGLRMAPLSIDIGPSRVSRHAGADLAKLDYAALDGTTLVFSIDGAADTEVTFAAPESPADIVEQINDEAAVEVAAIGGRNQLLLTTPTSTASSSIEVQGSSTSIGMNLLDFPAGLAATVPGTAVPLDDDDGQAGEGDDIRYGVENITGGSSDDTLTGDGAKNVIKGGMGNDQIAGGGLACAPGLTSMNGDVLQGEAGDDTFYLPLPNCWASLSGGAGENTANFGARMTAVFVSNNGQANDGAMDEKINVGVDIRRLIGGWGDDTLLGGLGDDTLTGGPGADVLNGSTGSGDTVDYSDASETTTISVCFTSTIAGCGPGDDGPGDGDQVYLIERVLGGLDTDTMTVHDDAAVSVTFEGGAGDDSLTGGAGNDVLLGGDGVDALNGGDGDDSLEGGDAADDLDGGDSDGDLCEEDPADTSRLNCEP